MFVQDVSFFCCIEIEGPVQTILQGMSQHTDSRLGLTFGAKSLIDGTREGEIMFYERDKYPWNPIGKVSFFWKPCELSSSDIRKLWIWVHPAFYQSIVDALIITFQMSLDQEGHKEDPVHNVNDGTAAPPKKKIKLEGGISKGVEETKLATRNVPFERTPKYLSSCKSIKMVLLKDTLNRFRLTGPLSQAVLQEALTLVDTPELFRFSESSVNEESQFCPKTCKSDASDASSQSSKAHHNFWLSSKGLVSPAELPPRMILSLLVTDPRLQIPDKRTKARPSALGNILFLFTLCMVC